MAKIYKSGKNMSKVIEYKVEDIFQDIEGDPDNMNIDFIKFYWNRQPTDQPWLLNGFNGTWAFSDHRRIPQALLEFLLEYYRNRLGDMRKHHIKSIELDEINELMNEIWDGPGSMAKIVSQMYEMRHNRLEDNPIDTKNVMKGYEIPTIESNLGANVVDKLEK